MQRLFLNARRPLASVLVGSLLTTFLAGCESRIEEAQAAAAYDLKDPDSAKFREVFERNGVVCGQINGKNSVGGYSGFMPFYAKRVNGKMVATILKESDDLTSWFSSCRKHETLEDFAEPNLHACTGQWSGSWDNGIGILLRVKRDNTFLHSGGNSPDYYGSYKVIDGNTLRLVYPDLSLDLTCNGNSATFLNTLNTAALSKSDTYGVCEGQFMRDTQPVGSPNSEPMRHGEFVTPSQIRTNVRTLTQSICMKGGYCYPRDAVKLTTACDMPGFVAHYRDDD
jgi:hypothetical protein